VKIGAPFYVCIPATTLLIELWRKECNQVRPHSALGYRPPAPEAIVSMGLTKKVDQSLGAGQSRLQQQPADYEVQG